MLWVVSLAGRLIWLDGVDGVVLRSVAQGSVVGVVLPVELVRDSLWYVVSSVLAVYCCCRCNDVRSQPVGDSQHLSSRLADGDGMGCHSNRRSVATRRPAFDNMFNRFSLDSEPHATIIAVHIQRSSCRPLLSSSSLQSTAFRRQLTRGKLGRITTRGAGVEHNTALSHNNCGH